MRNWSKSFITCSILCIALVGCTTHKPKSKKERTPEVLFERGNKKLDQGKLADATKTYEAIETEFPASEYASIALLRRGYAEYKLRKYQEALQSMEKFIQENPASSELSYAYYIKSLSYYEQIHDVARDSQNAELALENFDQLINLFPLSKYAQDAKIKKDFVVNTLAGTEMEVGRFYLRTNHINAALNRFKKVVDSYPQSIFIEEALYRMSESLLLLNLPNEAKKYGILLGYNYPSSIWYKRARTINNIK